MIIKWWKTKKAQRKFAEQVAISEWQSLYFQNIKFPILILDSKNYIAVSGLEEYYIDADINIFAVNQDSVLIDSDGKTFNFKKIDTQQWAPDKQFGRAEFQCIKKQVIPMLYMKNHKEKIDSVESIEEMIDLLLY